MSKNARITRTFLGENDHGIFTIDIHMEGDRTHYKFGGMRLDERGNKPDALVNAWIAGILKALRVESWEHLVGTYCRIAYDAQANEVRGIGHITEDRWFRPEDATRACAEASGVTA